MVDLVKQTRTAKGRVIYAALIAGEPATPEEIAEARIDGRCPRCGTPGEFTDAGYCLNRPACDFAY